MSDDAQAAVAEPIEETLERQQTEKRPKPKKQPRYNVILWDDQDHTDTYVMVMLQKLFGYAPTEGFRLAHEVDRTGRAIVLTTTMEHAELKRDQIRAYGKDIRLADCKGSMYASIEPGPG
jgi:ATP-dependent Clp protease adaptor protein ClpS